MGVVPPFAEYVFEEAGEVTSQQSTEEIKRGVGRILQRWGLAWDQEVPQLLELLGCGPNFPPRFVRLPKVPRVTLRFVKSIELSLPVRDLLSAAEAGMTNTMMNHSRL